GAFNTSGGASLFATFESALSGVTLNSPIDLSTFNNTVTVTNGLTLNNVTLNMGNPSDTSTSGQLTFTNTEALGGTGVINFGFFSNSLRTGSSAPLTIGSGITIQGRGGSITGSSAVTNNGLIDASIAGGSFSISAAGTSFTNNGTVEATNGASISVGF